MEGPPIVSVDTFRPAPVSSTQCIPLDEKRHEELPRAATSTTTTSEKPSVTGAGNFAAAIMPLELDNGLYELEVLELKNGQIEEALDEGCAREALTLGLSIKQTHEATLPRETPTSECAVTVVSSHLRSGSASNGSQSTGITSHTSTDHYWTENTFEPKPRSHPPRLTLRRSLSFTDYEKFLAEVQAEALCPDIGGLCPPVPPTSPARSVYSISSKKSLFSLKHTLRRLPRFQRSRATGLTAKYVNFGLPSPSDSTNVVQVMCLLLRGIYHSQIVPDPPLFTHILQDLPAHPHYPGHGR
jgi:hypothetical protein